MGLFRTLTIFLLFICAAPAAAQTFPALTGRVVDQANIIPDDREAAIASQLEQLQRATSRQLVVATVASLEGQEISDYAYRLGRHWQIGQSEANNGVVLLVAPNDRHVWIAVGYGLEGILTDALTGQIVRDQILPRFRDNDYPGGIEAGVSALIIQLAAPPEQAEQRALEAERARERSEAGGEAGGGEEGLVIVGILIILGIPFFLAVVSAARGGRHRRVSPWGYYDQRREDEGSGIGWFLAGVALDMLANSARGGGSSWSGGGGSSWGGGGGGSSWGGGGGGFSGGGGSFGGGGAGGSW